jgi:lysophospholipase L1-like esterase
MNTTCLQAKRVLIYWDSFTYGRLTGYGRLKSNERFTGIIQKNLWEGYEVIEEGLRWRTLSGENNFFPYRNGLEQFAGITGSHLPVDLIIIFLWTNDCNAGWKADVESIIKTFDAYKSLLGYRIDFMKLEMPKICLVCPPFVNEELLHPLFKDIFAWAEWKSKLLPEIFESIANHNNWSFFDSNLYVKAWSEDGIHINKESHEMLWKKLAECIIQII